MGLILLVGGIIVAAVAGVLAARHVLQNGTEMSVCQVVALVLVIIVVYTQFLSLLPMIWLTSWAIAEYDFLALVVVGTAVGLLVLWVILGIAKGASGATVGGLLEACYFSFLLFGLEAAVFSIG